MVIHEPLHPGEIVKDALFTDTDLNVTTAAEKLGVERVTLSRLLNGHSNISPEMALRLSLLLGTSIETWMNVQQDYDLWKLSKKIKHFHIKPLQKVAA